MDRVSEFLGATSQDRDRYVRCVQCEENVRFTPKQYRRYCPKCGISIVAEKEKPQQELNVKPNSYSCLYCLDNGIIAYKAQMNSQVYDFVAKCVCQAGSKMGNAIPPIGKCANAPTLNYVKHENLKLIDSEEAKKFREEVQRGN
jgi:hypothetical protein